MMTVIILLVAGQKHLLVVVCFDFAAADEDNYLFIQKVFITMKCLMLHIYHFYIIMVSKGMTMIVLFFFFLRTKIDRCKS